MYVFLPSELLGILGSIDFTVSEKFPKESLEQSTAFPLATQLYWIVIVSEGSVELKVNTVFHSSAYIFSKWLLELIMFTLTS